MGLSTVVSSSKIESLKAIHNNEMLQNIGDQTVVSSSKIESLKAIHNGHL